MIFFTHCVLFTQSLNLKQFTFLLKDCKIALILEMEEVVFFLHRPGCIMTLEFITEIFYYLKYLLSYRNVLLISPFTIHAVYILLVNICNLYST